MPPSTEKPGETQALASTQMQTPEVPGAPRPERLPETSKAPGLSPDDRLQSDLHAAFGDRYDLGPILGQGGFGAVHRGFDTRLKRPVAIKVARADRASANSHVDLLDEARRVAQLRHPGIVTVHDVAVVNDRCFIISELLTGPSLSSWLRQGRPSVADAVEIAASVAEALAHAHTRSLVHRDVKPSNIILIEDRRPVLVDFGLAMFDQEMSDAQGLISGTPAYMSPEQVRGEAHVPDGRTDIYSLAATLYEMLCGRPPFRGDDRQILQKVIHDPPQPPRQLRPEMPAEVERVCLKAMAKAPRDRYANGLDFAAALRQAMTGSVVTPVAPIHSMPTPPPPPAPALLDVPIREVEQPPSGTPPTSRRSHSSRSGSARRQLTVVRGSFEPGPTETELDDIHEDFAAIEAACRTIAESFDGSVLPSVGTSFLACFGYPVAREDITRRAVRAAMAIEDAVSAGSIAPGWSVRLVVHTGLAVVTEIPGQPIAVVGDVVTAATRLESSTEASGVLITDATSRLVEGFFEIEPAGEARIRGAGPSIQVQRVKGERVVRNRVEASDPVRLSPLIGRDREVELLREKWELATEGLGHVMLLVADAGLGKSRLVHVMKEHVAKSGGSILEWACSPYHQDSPLHPLIDAIERRLSASRRSASQGRLDTLLAVLREDEIVDPEHQALIADLLSIPTEGRLPALATSPERRKERLLEVLLQWLSRRSGVEPVLLVVEDLHWVDPTTEDLLRRIVETESDDRVLAILTFRPEYEPPWHGRGRQTQVALTKLSRRQVIEMIRAVRGSATVSQTVIDQIIDRTDGVPLFIEEFAKILAEMPDDPSKAVTIPTTLQDLLVARLDRIESDKDVAQLGAVIGRTFSLKMIEAFADLEPSVLAAELDKLVQAGLLFVKGSAPNTTYTFKHALIQDAAYQSLIKKRRQEFHRIIAEQLESGFPEIAETQPEVLARHFTEAGQMLRGVDYWLKAGLRARDRSAHLEAIRHLSRGLELVESAPPSIGRDALELSFRLPLSASHLAVRGYAAPEVEQQIVRARSLCEGLGEESPLFPVMMTNWAFRFIQGRTALARDLSDEILRLAAGRDDSHRAEAHWSACCTAWWSGRFADALDHGDRGLACYQLEASMAHARLTQQNSGPLLTAYTGLALWALGRLDAARARMDEAVALAERLNHPYTTAVTLWKPGFMSLLSGDASATLAWAERVLKVSQEQSFEFWIALGIALKGGAYTLLGRHQEAVPLLIESTQRIERTGCEMVHQSGLGFLAEALWRTGRHDEARDILDTAFSLNERDDERYFEAELHRRKALFLSESGTEHHAEAIARLEKSLSVASGQGARFFELRAAIALAKLRGSADDRVRVQTLADAFTEGFDAPDLIEARAFLEQAS